jgi:hypothetical protein
MTVNNVASEPYRVPAGPPYDRTPGCKNNNRHFNCKHYNTHIDEATMNSVITAAGTPMPPGTVHGFLLKYSEFRGRTVYMLKMKHPT